MARWQAHDKTDAMPSALAETDVIEVEAEMWGVSAIPAGLVSGWKEVQRYRKTGQTTTPEYITQARKDSEACNF